jgi:hypothetical protein
MRALSSNLAFVAREKQLAIWIAMRYRLAAQGNGQAALGHGDVADPATLDVSPPRAVPETR